MYVSPKFAERKMNLSARLAVSGRLELAAGFQLRQRETVGTVVLLSNILESLNYFCISSLGDEEFGCFLHLDDCHAQNRKHKYDATTREPDIAPTHVVFAITYGGAGRTAKVGKERPRKETGNELAYAPPACHKCQKPLRSGR